MFILQAILSGLIATLFLDIWQRILATSVGIPPSNWALVGRWFVSAKRGRLFPGAVAQLPEEPNELKIGWIGHYVTGVVYGFLYLAVLALLGMAPSLLNGLVFGALSAVVPWFFFMPAMGAGTLAKNTPNPQKTCVLALLAHTVFGLGLAVGALILQRA